MENKKITMYKVIDNFHKKAFEDDINMYIKEGWELYGHTSFCVDSDGDAFYCQALVKRRI